MSFSSTREAAVLAHDYLNGEATREQLVRAMQRLEVSHSSKAENHRPRRLNSNRLNSKKLILRRLESTIGEHICELWPECGTSCSHPNFQKETLQFRAFEDPLQRALTDDDRGQGVVQDVLCRIARKQDAKLSNLVVSQQREIAGLKAKAAAVLSKELSKEEMLHDHCKTAIASGLIDTATPATQALLRVLKHCRPVAAAGSPLYQQSSAPKKTDPLLFGAPSTAKVTAKFVQKIDALSEVTSEKSTPAPAMRPEEWVRQQRIKNASASSSIILQGLSKVPHPCDRQGLARFLPHEAPLSKLTGPHPGEGQRQRTGTASSLSSRTQSIFMPHPSDRQGLARFLPHEAPLSKLMADPTRSQKSAVMQASLAPWMLPASFSPLFEKSENSMMVLDKRGGNKYH